MLFGSGGVQTSQQPIQQQQTSSILSAQQQQSSLAVNTLQDVLQNASILTAAVAGPEIYGDEMDSQIALLNKLLASSGVGSGYYRPDQPPYQFTVNNIFHRLKGIGYNRLSKHKNSDGLVSLILKVPPTSIGTAQQKQKVIDAVNVILKPKTVVAGILGQPQKPSPTLHADIKSVIALGDDLTELILTAKEQGGQRHGLLSATELYNELMQQDRFNQLKQNLNCEKVVPRIEVDKSELENYLKRPPPGFEEIWSQAIRENPDPKSLLPCPIQGFQQLVQRKKMQLSVIDSQKAALNASLNRLSHFEGDILNAHNKHVQCIQAQKLLSHRLIRILAMQMLIQRYGLMIDDKEEQLQCRLEGLNAQLNAPGKLKEQVAKIYEVLQRDGESLKQRAAQRHDNVLISDDDGKELKRCLGTRQALLESLVEKLRGIQEMLQIMEHARSQ